MYILIILALIGWITVLCATFTDNQAGSENIVQYETSESTVTTKYGKVEGLVTSLGRSFRSIPYAAPPVGDLRFSAPKEPSPWNDTLQATEDPPGCPQECIMGGRFCPLNTTEDCLYLNVFTPLNPNNESLVVMIFIHGGGFIQGYGGGWMYNGTNMAYNNDVIVVTINYRLGILGSLYDPDYNLTGNFAYLDQKLAVKWVYNNIEAFGGNKSRITLFGESAGGSSMACHIMDRTNVENPDSVLFQRVIMESDPLGDRFR